MGLVVITLWITLSPQCISLLKGGDHPVVSDNRTLTEIADVPIPTRSAARDRIRALYPHERIEEIIGANDFPNDVRRAYRHVAAADLNPEEKANLWQLFVGALEDRHMTWSSEHRRGTDRSWVFQGGAGEALIIDPNGNLFRGENFVIAEGVLWQANYNGLRPITP